jgi:SAM-dependent methyltransferase
MKIDYDHAKHRQTLDGPIATLQTIFGSNPPKSILDLGCGAGTWMRAALERGVADVVGVDGIEVPEEYLYVPRSFIKAFDLSNPINLGRRFDASKWRNTFRRYQLRT